jgi:large subunit ribosomal protein L15
LNRFEDGTEVDPQLMLKAGVIRKTGNGVKVLGNGELEKKLVIKSNSFSKSAVEKIEKAGGKAEVI